MTTTDTCPHCGAPMKEYKHVMSAGLQRALRKLAVTGGQAHLGDCAMTYSERCNFQKLRYWGMVEQVYRADGHLESGVWRVTDAGWKFITGMAAVPKAVWTYRGEWVRDQPPFITADDPVPLAYRRRPDYQADAQGVAEQRALL